MFGNGLHLRSIVSTISFLFSAGAVRFRAWSPDGIERRLKKQKGRSFVRKGRMRKFGQIEACKRPIRPNSHMALSAGDIDTRLID